jgi:Zn-dependent protease with chaperone function
MLKFSLKIILVISSLIFLGFTHASFPSLQDGQRHFSLSKPESSVVKLNRGTQTTSVVIKEEKNRKREVSYDKFRKFLLRSKYTPIGVLTIASTFILRVFSPPTAALFTGKMLSEVAQSIFFSHLIYPRIFSEWYVEVILEGKIADPELTAIVQAVVERSNLTIPVKVYVIPTTQQNSLIMGSFRSNFTKIDDNETESSRVVTGAALCLDQGLLDSKTTVELKGIIAHECGYLLNQNLRSDRIFSAVTYGFACVAVSGAEIIDYTSTRKNIVRWLKTALLKPRRSSKEVIIEDQNEVKKKRENGFLLMTVGCISTTIGMFSEL